MKPRCVCSAYVYTLISAFKAICCPVEITNDIQRKRTTLDLTYPAPHVHTLKAVDSTSGEVLGLARWVRPSSTSPIPGNGDVDGEDQAAGVRNVEMDEIDHAFRAKVTGMLEEKKKELMGEGRDFWRKSIPSTGLSSRCIKCVARTLSVC